MNMNSKSKISVAIATYNGEKYIKEQLESILKQLSTDDEIIVSDDGSTDDTIKIVKSFNNSIIKIIDGPKKGIIKNFENAIKACSGDIIFLSDQDDIWDENKVEVIMNKFLDNNLVLVVHDAVIVNENLDVIDDSFFKFRGVKNGFLNNLIKNSFIGCCMAFRSSLKEFIIPIPSNFPMHDQWIGMAALKNKLKIEFIKDKLIKYRRHSDNASNFKKNNIFKMIKNRIIILWDLFTFRKEK